MFYNAHGLELLLLYIGRNNFVHYFVCLHEIQLMFFAEAGSYFGQKTKIQVQTASNEQCW